MFKKFIAIDGNIKPTNSKPVAKAPTAYDVVAKEFIKIIHRHNIQDQELSLFLNLRAMTEKVTAHIPNTTQTTILKSILAPAVSTGITWAMVTSCMGVTPEVPMLLTAGFSIGIFIVLFTAATIIRSRGQQLVFAVIKDTLAVIHSKDRHMSGLQPTPRATYNAAICDIKKLARDRNIVLSDEEQRTELKKAILNADRALTLEQIKMLLRDCRL